MSRLLKMLSLALAVVSLGILMMVAGCGSSGTQYRVFNAMSNPSATFNFDVTVNGAIVTPTGGLAFGSVQPASGYSGISSGSDSVAVYQAGTAGTAGAVPLVTSTLSLGGSTQYTIVLEGNLGASGAAFPWVAQNFPDNNTLPTNGNIEFRVIHAAPTLPKAVDIYLEGSEGSLVGLTPTFSSVAYGQTSQQPSEYVTLPAGTWWLYVVTAGAKTPLFPAYSYSPSTGSISTLVLTDNQSGNIWSYPAYILTDAQ